MAAAVAATSAAASPLSHAGHPYAVSVVGTDGKHNQLVFSAGGVETHTLSRDRRFVAFSTGSYIRDTLSVSTVTQENERAVASVPGLIVQVDWSPDGRQIVFSTDNLDLGCRVSVWLAKVSGGGARKLVDCAGHAGWAPDSRQVAYLTRGVGAHDGEMHVVDVATGKTTVLARGTSPAVAGAGSYQTLAWSPNGDHIAYIDPAAAKLHLVRVADGRDLAVAPAWWGTSWSPDSRRLTFVAERGGLAVIARDGTHFRILDRSADEEVAPSWSPDGRRIAYVRRLATRCSCRSEVHVVRADGSLARRLTNETATPLAPAEYVEFGPLFWSRDSRRVFYMHYVHFGE